MGTTSKALALLDFFTRQRPTIGLSELARLSGTNKATCFRLMGELLEHGFAEQLPATKEYRIGPGVIRLAVLREATVPTREAALPVLQSLADATGETAHMSYLVGGQLTTMAFAYGNTHATRVMMEDADTLPMYATSSGFAVLAFLPDAAVERVVSAPMPGLTAETPTDRTSVLRKIDEVRSRGWASTRNTFEADVASLSLPLFNADETLQGALALAAPSFRMTPEAAERNLPILIRHARQVMDLWGGLIPRSLDAQWRSIA